MAASPDRRAGRRFLKRALLGSALFVWLPAFAPAAGLCPTDRIDDRARVRHVRDGDTVVLSDGRTIRLIGINAPELGSARRPPERFAEAARAALRQLLADSAFQVTMRYGDERFDRYSRVLAHLFTNDGRNVQALLLERGLGAPTVFPPNLWQHECYWRTARHAREARRGIWSLQRYQGLSPRAVRAAGGGFYAVQGRVRNVERTRRSVWLDLGYDFALRIAKDDLLHFRDPTPESLRDRTVRALGWVSLRGRAGMRLRHPAQLEILE